MRHSSIAPPLRVTATSIYLVFAVDQQLHCTCPWRALHGHTIVWLTLVIADWGGINNLYFVNRQFAEKLATPGWRTANVTRHWWSCTCLVLCDLPLQTLPSWPQLYTFHKQSTCTYVCEPGDETRTQNGIAPNILVLIHACNTGAKFSTRLVLSTSPFWDLVGYSRVLVVWKPWLVP